MIRERDRYERCWVTMLEALKDKGLIRPDVDTHLLRLIGLGARHADGGQQGDEPYVVLADPEGNEFCVLTAWRDPALAGR